jgi:ubiquinone/menaquinone biosynthesis C-methylase UbiE
MNLDIELKQPEDSLKPGGSGIMPEDTPPKFFARHFSAYHFALPHVKDKDVLEIGFGDGYGANFLADHAKSVKAVDILEKNVALAAGKYRKKNLEFRKTDSAYSEFPDNIFDAVVSFQVIEHIPEGRIIEYLKAIKRVLKKHGVAFISTLNLDKNKKPGRPYVKNPFHIKEFTYGEFEASIKKVFDRYELYGLFYTRRLIFYERLKKLGIFKFFPKKVNIVDRFYDKIKVNDFVWKKKNIYRSIDFMALCRKE